MERHCEYRPKWRPLPVVSVKAARAAGTPPGIARAVRLPKGLSAPFLTATITILLQSDFTSMFRKKD